LFWQWMRLPGDVVFSIGGLIMSWDFLMKLWKTGPRADGPAEVAPAR
jgi:nitric oxide reductase subunit B